MSYKHKKIDTVVCVVGLGYVGLPLALAFGRTKVKTYGFDVGQKRVDDLKSGVDASGETETDEIKNSNVIYSTSTDVIKKANFIVVAVPTPVTEVSQPDLSYLRRASELIGRNLSKGAIVVYESTVYPGVTEEVCGPILEKESGLKLGRDFKIGYSPERINPGDKLHALENVIKIVAGMDQSSAKIIADTYGLVCKAGIHVAKTIKTAEATKVIENTQRDVNVALMNEFALIFHRLDIDTGDVLDAVATKWNALPFKPGLVGGHCIGVDPYYLIYKAEQAGFHSQVMTAARRINDSMADFVAEQVIQGLVMNNVDVTNAKVLVMGLTFKEDVRDMRNSKIAATINRLKQYNIEVVGFDPMLTSAEIKQEFDLNSIDKLSGQFDAVIVATPHRQFKNLQGDLLKLFTKTPIIFDLKQYYPDFKNNSDVYYWSL